MMIMMFMAVTMLWQQNDHQHENKNDVTFLAVTTRCSSLAACCCDILQTPANPPISYLILMLVLVVMMILLMLMLHLGVVLLLVEMLMLMKEE